jgi:hypothetical protein
MCSLRQVVADIVLEATHDILHAKVPNAKVPNQLFRAKVRSSACGGCGRVAFGICALEIHASGGRFPGGSGSGNAGDVFEVVLYTGSAGRSAHASPCQPWRKTPTGMHRLGTEY